MARTNPPAEQLVQLSDPALSVPFFRLDSARAEWLAAHGVKVVTDWADRPCITVADAYRLRDLAQAEADAAERDRRAKAAKLDAAVDAAQHKRQQTWTRFYLEEVAKRGGSTFALADARREAWIRTKIQERRLPAEVREQLTGINMDGLPGAANFHMNGSTYLSAEDMHRIETGAPEPTRDDPEGY